MKPLGKVLVCAAGILGLSVTAVSAALVTNDLNLRSGPGTNYGVITVLPEGASVDIRGCQGNWCRVSWRGRVGYASASYLADSGYVTRSAPRVRRYSYPRYSYYDDPYYYDRYYGPGYYGSGFGLSLRF